jgi:hypothetical protein
MKPYTAICLLVCVGCGADDPYTKNLDASPDVADDGNHSDLCCTITHDDVDSALWNDKTYPCYPFDQDTGMWVYPADASGFQYPWICFAANSATDCNDLRCGVGSSCQGPNGTGIVHLCNGDDQ